MRIAVRWRCGHSSEFFACACALDIYIVSRTRGSTHQFVRSLLHLLQARLQRREEGVIAPSYASPFFDVRRRELRGREVREVVEVVYRAGEEAVGEIPPPSHGVRWRCEIRRGECRGQCGGGRADRVEEKERSHGWFLGWFYLMRAAIMVGGRSRQLVKMVWLMFNVLGGGVESAQD